MTSAHLNEDKAAEYVMQKIDELRIYAAAIGEDDAIEKLEEAFQGVLGRYHARKIEALRLQYGDEPEFRP
jgi:hypothetical protein